MDVPAQVLATVGPLLGASAGLALLCRLERRSVGGWVLAVASVHLWLLAVLPYQAETRAAPPTAYEAGNTSDWYHVAGSECLVNQKRPLASFSDELEARMSGRSPCFKCVLYAPTSQGQSKPRIVQGRLVSHGPR
jgi:hypothetical protein